MRLLSALLASALTFTSTPVWAMRRVQEDLVPRSVRESERATEELANALGVQPDGSAAKPAADKGRTPPGGDDVNFISADGVSFPQGDPSVPAAIRRLQAGIDASYENSQGRLVPGVAGNAAGTVAFIRGDVLKNVAGAPATAQIENSAQLARLLGELLANPDEPGSVSVDIGLGAPVWLKEAAVLSHEPELSRGLSLLADAAEREGRNIAGGIRSVLDVAGVGAFHLEQQDAAILVAAAQVLIPVWEARARTAGSPAASGERKSTPPGSPFAAFTTLRDLRPGEGRSAVELAELLGLASAEGAVNRDLRTLRALGLVSLAGRDGWLNDRYAASHWVRELAKRPDGAVLIEQLEGILAGLGAQADAAAIEAVKPRVQALLSLVAEPEQAAMTNAKLGEVVDDIVGAWRAGRTDAQRRWGWGVNRAPINGVLAALGVLFPEAIVDALSRTKSVEEFEHRLVDEFHAWRIARLLAGPQGVEAAKRQLEVWFGRRLSAADTGVIGDIVAYRDRLKSTDAGREALYEWLSQHDAAFAANAIAAVGLNWGGVVPKLVAIIQGERTDRNPRAAARQLLELATKSTYGGLRAPAGVVSAAKRAWGDLSKRERALVDRLSPPPFPSVNPGVRPGVLILMRHGETGWSESQKNKWQGWQDVPITGKGHRDANAKGGQLRLDGLKIDKGYTSDLARSIETFDEFARGMGQPGVPVERLQAFRERDYGDMRGWRRSDVVAQFPDRYLPWRRGLRGDEVRPPGGENLDDTQERSVPVFVEKVLADLAAGKNVAVSAHGNSLRSILIALREHARGAALSEEEITKLEVPLTTPIILTFDEALNAKEFWLRDDKTTADAVAFLNEQGHPEVRVAQALTDEQLLDAYAAGDPSIDRRKVNAAMGRRLAGLAITDPSIVETTITDGVATVVLKRGRMNEFDEQLHAALYQAWERLESDPNVKAIIVAGAGGNFSAGADIGQLNERRLNGRYASAMGQVVFRSIAQSTKAKIGSIDGYALGGGYELALALDYLIASPSARVGQPEITLGLIPGWAGTQRLAQRLNNKLAAGKIILSGEFIDGRRALAYGLVDELAEDPFAAALTLARTVAQDSAPDARQRALAQWYARREERTQRLERLAEGQALRDHPHIRHLMSENSERWQGVAAELALQAVEGGFAMDEETEGEELEAKLFGQAMATPMAEWILADFRGRQRRPWALPALFPTEELADVPATRQQWVIDQHAVVDPKHPGGKPTEVMHVATLPNEPLRDDEVRILIMSSVAESNAGRQLPQRDPIDQLAAHRQERHGPGNVVSGIIVGRGRLVPNLPHLQLGAEVVTHNAAFADILDRGVIRGDATMDVKVVGYDEYQVDPSAPRRKLGGYATYGITQYATVMPKPDELTFEEAASYLLAYPTIYHNFRRTRLGQGDTLLATGLAGGTMQAAILYAKSLGLRRVIGTASLSPDEAKAFEEKFSDPAHGFEVKVVNRLAYDLSKPEDVGRFVDDVVTLNGGVPVDVALDFQGEFFPDAFLKSVKTAEVASSIVSSGRETWYGAEQRFAVDIDGVAGAARDVEEMFRAVDDVRDLPGTQEVIDAARPILGDSPEVVEAVRAAREQLVQDRSIQRVFTWGADAITLQTLHAAAARGARIAVVVRDEQEAAFLRGVLATTPALKNVVPPEGILLLPRFMREGRLDGFALGTSVRRILGEKPDVIVERANPQQVLGLPAGAHTLNVTYSAMLRSGGQVVFVEDTSGVKFQKVDLRRWVFQQDILFPKKRMISSHYASHTEAWIVNELVRKGLWKVEYPTKVYGFEDIPKGLEEQGRGKVVFLHGIPPGLKHYDEVLLNSIGVKFVRVPSGNPNDVTVALGPVLQGRFHRELTIRASESTPPEVIADRVKEVLARSTLPAAVQAAKVKDAETLAIRESARWLVARLLNELSNPGLRADGRAMVMTMVDLAAGKEAARAEIRSVQNLLFERERGAGLNPAVRAHSEAIVEAIRQAEPELQALGSRVEARGVWAEAERAIADAAAIKALADMMEDVDHPRTILVEERTFAQSPGWAILWQEALEMFRRRLWARTGEWATLDEAARISAARLSLHVSPEVEVKPTRDGSAHEATIVLWSGHEDLSKPRSASLSRVERLLDEQAQALQSFLQAEVGGIEWGRSYEFPIGEGRDPLQLVLRVRGQDSARVARAVQRLLSRADIGQFAGTPRAAQLLRAMNRGGAGAIELSPSWVVAVTGTPNQALGQAQALTGAPVVHTFGSTGWANEVAKGPAIEDIVTSVGKDSRGADSLITSVKAAGAVHADFRDPAGKSTGRGEATKEKNGALARRFMAWVGSLVKGMGVHEQEAIDRMLITRQAERDEDYKGFADQAGQGEPMPADAKLPGNVTLGASLAVAKASAAIKGLSLTQWLRELRPTLARTHGRVAFSFNIYNGGDHSLKPGETRDALGKTRIGVQEIMVTASSRLTYRQQLALGDAVKRELGKLLAERVPGFDPSLAENIGDEGGFSVKGIGDDDLAIDLVDEAAERAGFVPGVDYFLNLDVAGSSLDAGETREDGAQMYLGRRVYNWKGRRVSSSELIDWAVALKARKPHLVSIEDLLAEDDIGGWVEATQRLGNDASLSDEEVQDLATLYASGKLQSKVLLIGDDVYVTQVRRLMALGFSYDAATGILIKLNQNGTLTGTLDAMETAVDGYRAPTGWRRYIAMVSHRSGETTDNTIAHLAHAYKVIMIKTGAPSQGPQIPEDDEAGRQDVRRAKYLEAIREEEDRDMPIATPVIPMAADPSAKPETEIEPTAGALAALAETVTQGKDAPPVEILRKHELEVVPGTAFAIPKARPIASTTAERMKAYRESVGEL